MVCPLVSPSAGETVMRGGRAGSNEIGKATGVKFAFGRPFMKPTTHAPGALAQSKLWSSRYTCTVLDSVPSVTVTLLGVPFAVQWLMSGTAMSAGHCPTM